jgi:hypothetical protein
MKRQSTRRKRNVQIAIQQDNGFFRCQCDATSDSCLWCFEKDVVTPWFGSPLMCPLPFQTAETRGITIPTRKRLKKSALDGATILRHSCFCNNQKELTTKNHWITTPLKCVCVQRKFESPSRSGVFHTPIERKQTIRR